MHWGAKSRIAIFLLVILLFSFFVYAKGISGLDGGKEILEIEEVDIVVEEIHSPIDLRIDDIYFENELVIGEELDLIVEISSNYIEEIEAKVEIKIEKVRKVENIFEEEVMFKDEKKISFSKNKKLVFGPILFDKPGEYNIIATIESSVKEKDKDNELH